MKSSGSWWIGILFLASAPTTPCMEIWVSSSGDDSNPGTRDAPFMSISRAQREVRLLREKEWTSDVTVHVHGRHLVREPLRFGPMDGGDQKHSVTYASEGKQPAIVCGGQVVSDWREGESGRWMGSCSGYGPGDEGPGHLFCQGRRLPRARFPGQGEILRVVDVSEDVREVVVDRDLPDGVGAASELVILQNWSVSRAKVLSVQGRRIFLKNPMGWIGHGEATTASPGKPAYIEQDPLFLEEPGEWCWDVKQGKILLLPPEGVNPMEQEFIVPVAEQLLVVEGTPENPVCHLHFEGILFEHTAWPLPEMGYLGIQAGHHGTTIQGPIYVLPGAIELTHAADVSLKRCTVRRTGASGICLGGGCVRNLISQCSLSDIGGNGIMVGWRGKGNGNPYVGDQALSADWQNQSLVPVENEISHNLLDNCGAVNHGCVGIYDGFCRATRIVHNWVRDMPYTGISIGFRWDTSETSQRDCLVENNHIHDCMRILADGGGIYTLGYQPGTVLRGNYIHHIHRSPWAHGGAPNNGIFFDQGSTGYLVENNVIHDADGGSIRFNQTSRENLTWKDNCFDIKPGDPAFPEKLASQAGPNWDR